MQAAGQGKVSKELLIMKRRVEQNWGFIVCEAYLEVHPNVVRQCVCDNVENNAEASQTIGRMVYLFLEHNSGDYGLRTAVQDQA